MFGQENQRLPANRGENDIGGFIQRVIAGESVHDQIIACEEDYDKGMEENGEEINDQSNGV